MSGKVERGIVPLLLPAPARRLPDGAGIALLAASGVAAYFLFPSDLALLARIVSTAFLVLSLDLLIGYSGIATLGQAALSGIGAYAAANLCLHGIREPLAMVAAGAVAGSMAGLLSGLLILRASGLPQLVLSIALVQLVHEAANKAAFITGGSDGLAGFDPGPVLGLFRLDLYGRTAYLFSLALLILAMLLLRRIVRAPFGLLCRAIKEDPHRVRAMGGAVRPALTKMYVVSGAIAGIGGALAALTSGVVGLDAVSFESSASALVMLVLGGAGRLYGALLGTTLFMVFEHIVSAANPFHWLTMVGALLIAVVLFLPRGLQHLAPALQQRLLRKPTR